MIDSLANALLGGDNNDKQTFRVGTVTADATPGPVTVQIAGSSDLDAAYLASYTPAANDVVLILQTAADLIIVGLITSGG